MKMESDSRRNAFEIGVGSLSLKSARGVGNELIRTRVQVRYTKIDLIHFVCMLHTTTKIQLPAANWMIC